MADSGLSGVTVDELIERLSTAVENNDEKTREEVDEVLKLENQLNIGDREAFQKAKSIQCLEAIRLQSLSLLQLLFSKDHVLVEDHLDFKTNKEFISTAIQADFLEGVKYLIENGLKLDSDYLEWIALEPDYLKWIALFQAVEYEKPQIVDFLLNEQPDHIHSTVAGMTLIGLACKTGNFDVLKLLLNSTATFDLNRVCGEHVTPLQWCFENRFQNRPISDLFDCVKILVENGADINIKGIRTDQTLLLSLALWLNFPDALKYVIKHGADLTSCDSEKNTALHHLCEYPETEDSLDCIKIFLEEIKIVHGLHILDSKNIHDETPLYIAVRSGNEKVVDILVEAGCDVNVQCLYNNETLLAAAIRMKSSQNPTSDCVTKLITAGSNVNASDEDGMTPLMLATSLRDLDSIKLLIQHGADPNSKDCDGLSILDYCFKFIQSEPYCETSCKEFLKTVDVRFKIEDISEESLNRILDHDDADTLEYLISNGLDIHHIGKNNRNILHLLEDSRKINNIKPYCDEADVNQQDIDGDTPLMWAANEAPYFGPFLIKYFIERGADVNLRNKEGQTPLMMVATDNNKEILQLFVEAGSDVNIRAYDGRTALQYLVYGDDTSYLDCLRLLLENGGSPSLDYKDLNGVTLFQYVLQTKPVSCMWYLITQNCSINSVPYWGKKIAFFKKKRDKLLKIAKIFYHSGASRQLILDIFEMDDDDEQKFKTFCGNLSLTELCRRQIRVSIGPGIQEKLQKLNIAPKLIWYICLMDLIPIKIFDIKTLSDDENNAIGDDDNADYNDDTDDFYVDYDDFHVPYSKCIKNRVNVYRAIFNKK